MKLNRFKTIFNIVKELTGLSEFSIMSVSRKIKGCNARSIIVYQLVKWGYRIMDIVRIMGRKHHTVKNSLKNYENRYNKELEFKELADRADAKIARTLTGQQTI